MATCPIETIVLEIPREECIGNSLGRMNEYFSALKSQSCDNYSRLNEIDANISNLQSLYTNLSSATLPGAAKAWVKFDGTRDVKGVGGPFLSNRFLYSSYNISSVLKKNTGNYRIYFQTPFKTAQYAIVGTSSETQSSGGSYTWLQPYTYTPTFVDVRVHGNFVTEVADPRHVSIVIF